jgi:spore maturation protein CgeB
MKLVILGLSITSSWGNGHATTYRALIREFAKLGHKVVFLERDVPWYASQRDLAAFPSAEVILYADLEDLRITHDRLVREADAVIVGSYVPDGVAVCHWVLSTATGVTGFYDIDTPVTLAQLARGCADYLSPELIPRFDLYLSFAGGRSLDLLRHRYGAANPVALYCSVDPEHYFPEPVATPRWQLGYLGTYSTDRQPALEALLIDPARRWPNGRFVVAGPQYPAAIPWPLNVERIDHLAPADHRGFYNNQRFTLNVTRADMVVAGHSPSVRLFEAAACATPIISDQWDGLAELFVIGEEILVATNTGEALEILRTTSRSRAAEIGAAGRNRILAGHTAAHRAAELEHHIVHCVARQLSLA